MKKTLLKKIVKVTLYICASIILLLLIGIIWLHLYCARHVWESPQISFMTKVRITASSGLACPKRVYIVQPDRRNKFVLVTNDYWLDSGERHIIYNSAGHWIYAASFDQNGANQVTIEPIIVKSNHETYLVNSKAKDPMILWRKSSKNDFTIDFLNSRPWATKNVSLNKYKMADELLSTGNWQLFLAYGEGMMKNDPVKYSPLVIRYAAGDFTAYEKTLNSSGIISAAKVQAEASRLKWFYCQDSDGNYINLGRR